MSTVLAAIDHTEIAESVVATAAALANVMGADVTILHVKEAANETSTDLAGRFGAAVAPDRIRLVDGDPTGEIIRAAADPEVAIVVVGARQLPGDARPAGHIALAIVEGTDQPVVVVPPAAALASPERSVRIRRVLVPLEGTSDTTAAIADTLGILTEAGVELVALHVFEPESAPAFWDQPGHAADSYAADFVTRWCTSPDAQLHLRRGSASQTVIDVADVEGVDLIALGWSQRLSSGRARVVRAALIDARAPILLVPVLHADTGADDDSTG